MTADQINSALAPLAAKFHDRRLHVMKVTPAANSDHGTIKLTGKVLDHDTLRAVHDALRPAFPNHRIDDSAVAVLRRDTAAALHTVATSLTDLHADTSFLSELLTQVLHGQPLEVLEEHDKWAFVRQADGYLGWAYKPYLSAAGVKPAQPTHIICVPSAPLVTAPQFTDHPIAHLLGGTFVHVSETTGNHSRVTPTGTMIPAGWAPTSALRPLTALPLTGDAARQQILADARRFIGVYYLWGGNSAFGTDCSGLSQLSHRMSGHTLPRDCDLQFAATRPVEGSPRPADLAFFHSDSNPNKITHVALALGGSRVLHSSRGRNGVYEDDLNTNENLKKTFVGFRRLFD